MVERFQKKNRWIKKSEVSPAEIKPTLIMSWFVSLLLLLGLQYSRQMELPVPPSFLFDSERFHGENLQFQVPSSCHHRNIFYVSLRRSTELHLIKWSLMREHRRTRVMMILNWEIVRKELFTESVNFWMLITLDIHLAEYRPLNGCSNIELPEFLSSRANHPQSKEWEWRCCSDLFWNAWRKDQTSKERWC